MCYLFDSSQKYIAMTPNTIHSSANAWSKQSFFTFAVSSTFYHEPNTHLHKIDAIMTSIPSDTPPWLFPAPIGKINHSVARSPADCPDRVDLSSRPFSRLSSNHYFPTTHSASEYLPTTTNPNPLPLCHFESLFPGESVTDFPRSTRNDKAS